MRKETLTLFSTTLLVAVSFGAARGDDEKIITAGPISNLGDLQDTAKMLFKAADTNNDGRISQKEAVDAGNLIVGGFFFRADADGDGKVTKEEADQARENLFNQRPILRFIFERAQQETAAQGSKAEIDQVGRNIMAAIDANHDGALDATELRQAVNTGVQSLFLTADGNGDGHLEPAELNAAVVEVGRAGLEAAFQTADLDKNGAVSREEFEKAVVNPASVVFRIMDADNDGQLSREELQSGVQILVGELRNLKIDEPANSIPNQVKNAIENAPAASGTVAPTPAAVQPQ